MLNKTDVISYHTMCVEEGRRLQQGMNYRPRNQLSIFLMSLRPGAPYADDIDPKGVLIYEGHDVRRRKGLPDPKKVDQPLRLASGKLTQNGLFYESAMNYKISNRNPEVVKVYQKLSKGRWKYNGVFKLIGVREDESSGRKVFKFTLERTDM